MRLINNYSKTIIRLGFPIMIGQLGMVLQGFADTIMVGQYSTDALASASFVNNVIALPILITIGFSNGLTPIVASLYAKGDIGNMCKNLYNAFFLNLALGVVLFMAMTLLYANLHLMGQPVDILPLIKEYYFISMLGLPVVAITNVQRQFFDGMGRVNISMWMMIAGNVLNVIFNYFLIFGVCGFPELGLAGAGISTVGSRIVVMFGFGIIMRYKSPFSNYIKKTIKCRLEYDKLRQVMNTSLPLSVQQALEMGFFSFCGIMMGWLGKTSMAAYQILIMLSQLGFMIYLSYAAGMSIRMSQAMGQNNLNDIRLTGRYGYRIVLIIATVSSIVFITLGEHIVQCFTSDSKVIAATMEMIIPLLIYQYADASQITFCNALRGIAYVKPMVYIAVLSYLIVNVPVAYVFGFIAEWGAPGIVYSFSTGLTLAGLLYYYYYRKQLNNFKNVIK